MPDGRLLIVEDDPGLQKQLKWSLDRYQVEVADDREAALQVVRKNPPQVVTLDLGLPPDPGGVSEGFAALTDILNIAPFCKVIVITGNDDFVNPVRAIGLGAYDFYQKPVDADLLAIVVDRAFRLYALEEENRKLSRLHISNPLEGIIAASPEMHDVCRMVERIAPSDMTTLILGESGTGKEVIAHALHQLSDRAKKPFVAVNSAAIPESLLESELFGYEKGAFTGATQQTKGRFELANDGTFFLDEIGDIPLSLQPKLLRVLQERKIERVGGRQEIPINVRIVCATHQDLEKLIREGRFREDLYFRINEVTIQLPPLRERSGDVLVLARAFMDRYAKQMRSKVMGFTEAALDALESYHWPGNVRELDSKIKRAVVMAGGTLIDVKDLQLTPTESRARLQTLREARESAERYVISQALSEAGGNLTRAAEILEVTRPTLYALLEKFGLKA